MTTDLNFNIVRRRRDSDDESRTCEWPECTAEGIHRAPLSPDALKTYRWFCLEHAREYNKTWNYYDGMSDEEVEADRRRDTFWRRPSWPLGSGPDTLGGYHVFPDGTVDGVGTFEHEPPPHHTHTERETPLETPVRQALAVFGLEIPVSVDQVKARYKDLVKRHHPDAHGPEGSDEKIKQVNEAYRVILEFLDG